jgi:hypothetical protein
VAAFNKARIVRDSLMNIPDRVASLLAIIDDAHKIHEVLLQEIRIFGRFHGDVDVIQPHGHEQSCGRKPCPIRPIVEGIAGQAALDSARFKILVKLIKMSKDQEKSQLIIGLFWMRMCST